MAPENHDEGVSASFLDKNVLYYSITLKHLNGRVIDYKEDFEQFIQKHYKDVQIIKTTYECDSKMKLHAHILAICSSSWKPKSIRYWHQYYERTNSYQKYLSYITKYARNPDEQDQILLSHQSYHNNLFLN